VVAVTPALTAEAVAAVDSTGQAAEICDLGIHLRDSLWRVDSAGLGALDAPGGLVVAGMGGSAVGALLARGALHDRLRRPLLVADGYELPSWIGEDALVLCSSYSGATAETLACYDAAREAGAKIVVATTGGPLAERARGDRVPVVPLPGGFQPRAAVGYSLVAALETAALAGAGPSLRGEVEAAASLVEGLAAEWGPDSAEDSEAKALARRLEGTVPVFMGAGLTAPAAYRWKCQLNENSKLLAFASELPELDHNEVVGWSGSPDAERFAAVFLEDPEAHERVRARVEVTAGLIEPSAAAVERVRPRGNSPFERVVSLVLLGDLVSLYLAVLRGVDPGEIAAIDTLKRELAAR
jgi:glucose/mannose-6-phosphate isomerase